MDVAYVDGRTRTSAESPPRHLSDRFDGLRDDLELTERVSDKSSKSDVEFIGDYIDIAAAGGSVRVVWTDRRTVRHVSDQGSDIYADQWAT